MGTHAMARMPMGRWTMSGWRPWAGGNGGNPNMGDLLCVWLVDDTRWDLGLGRFVVERLL